MKNWLLGTTFAVVALSSSIWATDVYKIDTAHSTVGFSVRHMVLSNTRGSFGDYTGDVVWDKDLKNAKINGTVKVASIDTRDQKRDDHLRSADFMDAVQFPEIQFHSTKIRKAGKVYEVTGQLTMKGVTRTVKFPLNVSDPVKDPWGNTRVNFSSEFKINRQDYGISWNKKLDNGGLVVGDEVTVQLDIEGVKAAN
ncbi:polyisoprenoid-binding protein [bacterium]|nr:polyisoprenoid-binding protein [bacterium]